MSYKRYSSIAQTFSFMSTKVTMGVFSGNNLYFSGAILDFGDKSAGFSKKRGFLMKLPYLETSTVVTG